MKSQFVLCAMAVVIVVPSLVSARAMQDDDDPKYEIEQVMKEGMKGGLLRKVASGQASDEEKEMMTEMVASLAHYEPQKGDTESWEMKTEALAEALEAFLEGDEGAAAALREASNCMACHQVHKP